MNIELIALIVVGLISLVAPVYCLTLKMSKPEKMLHDLTDSESDECKWQLRQYGEWLASTNLQFVTGFRFGMVRALVFQQQNVPRYFLFHFHQGKLTFDIQSYFQEGTSVETCTSGDAGMHEFPGNYKQSFPGLSPDEAWRRHLEGEAHFINGRGFVLTALPKPFKEAFLDEIRATMRYTRSQPFWLLRQYYRFFVTRYRIRNRSVADRFP